MPPDMLADAPAIGRMIASLAQAIAAANPSLDRVALVGIQTRGVPLAKRLLAALEGRGSGRPKLGTLDITFYRDDFAQAGFDPQVRETELPFDVMGMKLVLVDDVLHTGRTIRAAMDELMDFGRPAAIELAVLVDRGGRELPIAPTYVGMTVPAGADQAVKVYLSEVDASGDAVRIVQRKGSQR